MTWWWSKPSKLIGVPAVSPIVAIIVIAPNMEKALASDVVLPKLLGCLIYDCTFPRLKVKSCSYSTLYEFFWHCVYYSVGPSPTSTMTWNNICRIFLTDYGETLHSITSTSYLLVLVPTISPLIPAVLMVMCHNIIRCCSIVSYVR